MAELVLSLGGDVAVVGGKAPDVPAAAGDRSESGREAYRRVRLQRVADQAKLREVWEKQIRPLPPAFRERWLLSADAAVALGAVEAAKLLKALNRVRGKFLLTVPGGAWLLAYELEGIYPPPPDPNRKHAANMVLTRQETAVGDGRPHRRYIPPQCRAEEDFIDSQDEAEARFYPHPPSPSAIAIWRISFYGRRDSKPIKRGKRL